MDILNKEILKSRFFYNEDENTDFFLYNIPNEWWSRTYEYLWAGKFAEENDVCLDAACGITHHLKYYLAYNCKKVYACDLDQSILNKELMLDLMKAFGEEAKDTVEKIYDNIDFKVANLTNLPYNNNTFDKIYCISVLEHLSYEVMENSFKEFSRVLKEDGLVIITFDYPNINLELLSKAMKESNLEFLDEVDFNIYPNMLESWIYTGLNCGRAILKKSK